MKKLILTLISSAVMTLNAFGANNQILLNGESINLDTPVKIVENRSYVPLRELGEKVLGAEVSWDASTKSAILIKDNITVVVPMGSMNIYVNNIPKDLSYPAFSEDGKSYVPVRAIAEGFNYTVGYTNNTITISDPSLPQLSEVSEDEDIATLHTNYGDIKVRFFPEYAPKAVENFITHAKNGYYNGVTFHRVINDFMIQGGDPTATGMGGESIWKSPFENEVSTDLRHFKGALAMANSGTTTSNGSQFYIVQGGNAVEQLNYIKELTETANMDFNSLFPDYVVEAYEDMGGYPYLDYNYTVFGQVVEGLDIVDKIASVETDENDKPIEDVVIESITFKNT